MIGTASLAAASLFNAVSTARADAWYILDAPHDRCELARAAAARTGMPVSTPMEFADAIRRAGRVPSGKVVRDTAGTIVEADVEGIGTLLSWFATEDLCQKAKVELERSGEITQFPGSR